MVTSMNSYLAPQLATDLHQEMITRRDHARTVASARRRRRAERLTRRAAALARRAADLVEDTHR
jgi:hypothetical protein